MRSDRVAAQPIGSRPDSVFHDDDAPSRGASGRFRHHPFPHRPISDADVPVERGPHSDDIAWSPGFSRHAGALCGIPGNALISISNAQRTPISNANIIATVYHGLPTNLLEPTYHPRGGYLAFIGRISPEKGIERAIAIGRLFGVPLKIAAKVDRVDEQYFRKQVEPLLDDPSIEFIGEIGERAKSEFLGEAQALLFPIDWPEPFGLVMIEAMACGTPVLAFRSGSVPEIIEDGITGRIVSSVDEAILALPEVIALDRRTIRRRFEERFTAARMARDYVNIYRKLLKSASRLDGHALAPSLAPTTIQTITSPPEASALP